MTILGILKELHASRVSLTPDVLKKKKLQNLEVWIEKNAGVKALYSDSEYEAVGAKIVERKKILSGADIVSSIIPIEKSELETLKKENHYISSFQPFADDTITEQLSAYPNYFFSLDMVPRSTLAQSMDVLSSMASIAGYKSVLIAANELPKYFPMLITSAGSIKPAKVLIIGAGVAGLQAIATAKRLGASVEAMDTRSAAEEEVKSLGAKFIQIQGAKDATDQGYGAEQTEDFIKKQQEIMKNNVATANVVITTAVVRGRKAPVIVTKEMVERMTQGSVVIDLASATGGNCEVTKDREKIQHAGVTVIGNSHLADLVPQDASFMYANNLMNFIERFFLNEDKKFLVNKEDEIISNTCIVEPKNKLP